MKSKFWAVVIAILIFIPTVVAVANYFTTKDSPVSQNSVSSIVLVDPAKTEYSFEKSAAPLDLASIDGNMVQFFTDISMDTATPTQLPEQLTGSECYKVRINNYGRDVEYDYYFTDQAEHCFFVNPEGKCFKINRNYAAAFLNSSYGRYAFDRSAAPKMNLPTGEVIAPDSISWTYTAVDGVKLSYNPAVKKEADSTVYLMPEKIQVLFDILPGHISLSVSEGETEVWNGMADNLSDATTIHTNTELTVKVKAEWFENSATDDSFGKAEYTFKCIITDRPVFCLDTNSDDVTPGDFVNLTALNVLNVDEIKFTSTPALDIAPIFYKDGHAARAILPISDDTPAGTYIITLSVGDTASSPLELVIKENNYGTKTEVITSTALSKESQADFDEAMGDILSQRSSQRYFDGKWIYPMPGGGEGDVSTGYGKQVTTAHGYSYRSDWVRVILGTGNNVIAMNSGKVVYKGEQTMTGMTVVIDHGLGIKTIYSNMQEIKVEVGDVVNTGDVIGISGATGYSDGAHLGVAMTVGGEYVCPYEIWDEQGIIFSVD